MKIWFFVEGESESNCIVQLIRKFYPSISLVNDPAAYINVILQPGQHCCYVEDCGNVERIPHEINDQHHNILRSGTDLVIIFCDIEKDVNCASNRIQRIQTVLNSIVNRQNIRFVFSRLTIESIYWQYPDVMKKTIKVIYSSRRNGRSAPLFEIPKTTGPNYPSLSDLMKSIGNMSYKKPEFSNYFFPRIPTVNELRKNETLDRLVTVLDSIK